MKKRLSLIGSGQAGCRLCNLMAKKYEYDKSGVVLFNTTPDDDFNVHILPNVDGNDYGSGRNPMYTLEKVIPKNSDYIKENVMRCIERSDSVVLFNSLGGGSGSALNYWIIKEVLIPVRETNKDFKIFLIPIMGFEHEGNPVCSNGIAMLNMYYSLTNSISILPVQNDVAFEKGSDSTFDITNNKIVDSVFNIIDYEYFLGYYKSGGIGTLDKNEHNRVVSPSGGFLSFTNTKLDEFNLNANPLNNFPMETATSMIVMFRTKKGDTVDVKYLRQLEKQFPNALRIFSESGIEEDESCVDIIFNGCALPIQFVQKANDIISKTKSLKTERKEIKKTNKTVAKIGKTNLFGI